MRSATQRNREFPCRGFAPAIARCLSLPDRCPGTGLPKKALTLSVNPRMPSYMAAARAVAISRLIAQMKAASSRATAVTATVASVPLRVSAR